MFIIFFYNRKMDMIYVNDEFVSYLFEGMYLSLTIFITEEMIFREGFFIYFSTSFDLDRFESRLPILRNEGQNLDSGKPNKSLFA